MKSNSIKIMNGIVFIVILVMLFSVCSVADEKPIIIKYSDSDPPNGLRTDFVKDVWLPEIVKQTNGKVKIQDFWGGALLTPPEALMGIRDGVTDMGMVFGEFYPKQLPLFQMFKLFAKAPIKYENLDWTMQKIFEEIPEFQTELEAWNQKILMVTQGLPFAYAASYPIKGIDDFKNKKWRASSKWHLDIFKNLGAIPVSVPWIDVYMALQTGIIDGVLTNYDGLHMMKFEEMAPNLLLSPVLWGGVPYVHTINLDKWNSLPQDVQEGITRASRIAEKEYAKIFKNAFDKIVAEEKEMGCTITYMSDEDIEKWADEDFYKRLRNIWVQDAKELGIEDPAYKVMRMKLIIEEGLRRE